MKHFLTKILFLIFSLYQQLAFAEENYRYLHVTIDTPWAIFIFLLFIVLFPFVLMALLHWYFAYQKNKEEIAKEMIESQDGGVNHSSDNQS